MKQTTKQLHKEIAEAFTNGLSGYTQDIATVVNGDNDDITIALNSSVVCWVHYIVEISLKHHWIKNVYTVHGNLTAYELGVFEKIVAKFFEEKDAE